jgi:predicted DsbA family dithiol-disulfide isomerase
MSSLQTTSPGRRHDAAGALFRLDIFSDLICPWCYIGKRRLEAALPVLADEGLRFEVTWRPFQLNPAMPAEGLDRRTYRSAKFGSWEKSEALDAQVADAGAGDGIAFRHALMARTPNTVASHALLRFAHGAGGSALQGRLIEALFAAYFTQGRDVGDLSVLADLGAEAGLRRDEVVSYLTDPASRDAVLLEEKLARDLCLNGVPSVAIDGYVLFSGAQPTPAIVRVLRQAAAELLARRAAAAGEASTHAGS